MTATSSSSSSTNPLQYKEQGDNFYRQSKYTEAIEAYSKAIQIIGQRPPIDGDKLNTYYVCYSNRCACYLQLKNYSLALADAQKCVSLKQDWPKGYLRLGSCLIYLNKVADAMAAYEQVLILDPNNTEAKNALSRLRNPFSTSSSSTSSNTSYSTTPSWMNSIIRSYNQLVQKILTYDWQSLSEQLSLFFTTSSNMISLQWNRLSLQHRQYIQYGAGFLIVYYFFFYRSSSYSEPVYYYSGSGGGGYGGGLSWSTWAMVMYAAYKIPPMFPQQLGEYAQPFFGMNWATFMWLLNLLTNSSRGSGFMFGGPPRRRY